MHWLVLTVIGALANAAFALLWKQAAGRADTMALLALAYSLTGGVILAYLLGWQNLKLHLDTPTLALVGGLVATNLLVVIFFSLALKAGPVSFVNPVFSGILNVGLVIMAVLVFDEKLTWQSGLGIATVLAGTTMIAMG